MTDATDVIESGTQSFPLALPTLTTGALDGAVLVERIAQLEELGVTPRPVDLAQALLHVNPAPDEQFVGGLVYARSSGVVLDPPLPQAVAALFGPYRMRKTSLGEPAAPFWVA
ncbi:hypothetical protein OG819_56445 [Streptomyces sp. NBC_01549]|uniref:hypothetical protein n=1 Tax=Streptomyces sp. NBC_01549 TaxID=2975874 RepID=UPI0022555E95|nr:hypothetical protein [Streptomyces sp. NBC_01549]MCX4598529.1 hypothetical protein [Streptomyces sp. NBC_01549]